MSMNTPAFVKAPAEVLDYMIDWSDWLDDDTISTSTWTVSSGLTKVTSSNTTTTATVWVSGGTAGSKYTCVDVIVTAGGRTAQRTLTILAQER